MARLDGPRESPGSRVPVARAATKAAAAAFAVGIGIGTARRVDFVIKRII